LHSNIKYIALMPVVVSIIAWRQNYINHKHFMCFIAENIIIFFLYFFLFLLLNEKNVKQKGNVFFFVFFILDFCIFIFFFLKRTIRVLTDRIFIYIFFFNCFLVFISIISFAFHNTGWMVGWLADCLLVPLIPSLCHT